MRGIAFAILFLFGGASSLGESHVASSPHLIWIPAGTFTMGATPTDLAETLMLCASEMNAGGCDGMRFSQEFPSHEIFVSRFGLDRTEVSQRDYAACVRAGYCAPVRASTEDARIALPSYPVVGVTHQDAERYCSFVHGRLPTEAEWEKAARGPGGRLFPWGNIYDPRLANHGPAENGTRAAEADGFRDLAPVGSFPDGASPYGVLDLAGNAWEWTSDFFADEAYGHGSRVNPTGPRVGHLRVVRGGSWRFPAHMMMTMRRGFMGENSSDVDLGFRCAYDAN